MMRFKNMLNLFSKTEVQDDERFSLAPMREREELLCEQSELSNSGEGYISCAEHTVKDFSPFTSHFSQLCLPSPDATRHPLPREGNKVSCAEHTVKNLLSYSPIHLFTLKHKLDYFAYARNDDFCAKHTEKNLLTYLPIHLFTFKKAAFTLAEVLITLAIIGVVAALTLPTLISNHQKQAYVTGLKKAYANLQNVFAKMAYDEDVTEWSQTYCFIYYYNTAKSEECFNRFKKQFNVVKGKGGASTEEACWDNFSVVCPYIYTNDGIMYLFACEGYIGNIFVDVNGDKGPNKSGRDKFVFIINYEKNRIEPFGLNFYHTNCTTANVNSNSWGAITCTAKVLIEGKMDY